jgi:hypothetical protein
MSKKDKLVRSTKDDISKDTSAPKSHSSTEKSVLGSKYLASEEEHRKFAAEHPDEVVFGFWGNHPPKE